MNNHGNFVGSLGNVCRWLGAKAEELGVEIYPGFAATEVLYGDKGEVLGVATGDMGVGRDGKPKDSLHPRHGAARQIHAVRRGRARLADQAAHRQIRPRRRPRAAEIRHRPEGAVAGRPGQAPAGPGAALLRLAARRRTPAAARSSITIEDNQVVVGFVVHLNYKNPTLSPFDEFQRFKTHPMMRDDVRGRQAPRLWRARADRGRLAIGAQARLSRRRADRLRGRLHERAAHQGLAQRDAVGHAGGGSRGQGARRPAAPMTNWPITRPAGAPGRSARDLKKVRNVKPLWSKLGTVHRRAARRPRHVDQRRCSASRLFGTLKHGKPDYATLKPLERGQADRLSQARRRALLRQAVVGVPVQHQSRGRPAGPSEADRSRRSRCAKNLPRLWRAGAALLPGRASMRWSMATRRRRQTRASSSTRRTASTAKPATSRTRPRTSPGPAPEGGGGPNYPNM